MKKKKGFFQKRSVVATFGILALLIGVFFIQPAFSGQVTGNSIAPSSGGQVYLVPFFGIALLVCSVILLSYSIIRKD